MSHQQIVLHGHIRPDGTLQIDERVDLPPGPIQVTVEASSETRRRRRYQIRPQANPSTEADAWSGGTKQRGDRRRNQRYARRG